MLGYSFSVINSHSYFKMSHTIYCSKTPFNQTAVNRIPVFNRIEIMVPKIINTYISSWFIQTDEITEVCSDRAIFGYTGFYYAIITAGQAKTTTLARITFSWTNDNSVGKRKLQRGHALTTTETRDNNNIGTR